MKNNNVNKFQVEVTIKEFNDPKVSKNTMGDFLDKDECFAYILQEASQYTRDTAETTMVKGTTMPLSISIDSKKNEYVEITDPSFGHVITWKVAEIPMKPSKYIVKYKYYKKGHYSDGIELSVEHKTLKEAERQVSADIARISSKVAKKLPNSLKGLNMEVAHQPGTNKTQLIVGEKEIRWWKIMKVVGGNVLPVIS